ncbi:hypothetical protein [Actinoplanes sp. NPDC049802]|uniref:electron transfer flavoprotein subunit beta/FixA family protein n=1 Tax=Actinoplanes sp. NPDC049802 TaxID=3154742 RepID=UPI0034039D68
MRIAVAYKWAGDPQEANVGPDGVVDMSRAKPVVSDYDAVAIAVGRQLADSNGAELIGLSVGDPAAAASMATKTALARGLDRVVVVTGAGLTSAGATRTASVLAEAVRRIGGVDLILTGDSSIDAGAKLVPAMLGGILGWPTLTDADKVSISQETVTLTRVVGDQEEQLAAGLPAVLAVSTDAAAVKAPGMKDVLAAGKKPVEVIAVTDLADAHAGEGAVRSARPLDPPARRRVRIDATDPAEAARTLLESLRADGVLALRKGE